MNDELTLDGKVYVSSKRAAQMSRYTQDYVGQLARAGHIDAQRIGGLWYVFMDSLNSYKAKAETFVPKPPEMPKFSNQPTDTLITFDGKDYISAARASEITGYNQDYVGQLARAGKVLSRQVGTRWYIHREGLLAHKEEKDRMLGAVQTQAVGIPIAREQIREKISEYSEPLMTYSRDDKALLPSFERTDEIAEKPISQSEHGSEPGEESHIVPIRTIRRPSERSEVVARQSQVPSQQGRSSHQRRYVLVTLILLPVLGIGLTAYILTNNQSADKAGFNAEMEDSGFIEKVTRVLEHYLTKELIYRRQ